MLKACLNGARRAGMHPALPLTPADLAAAARASVAAGADAIHIHPRGADGRESLTPDAVGAAVSAVRAACPGVRVGVTTGAWIEPDAHRRLALVRAWIVAPDFASVNFSEAGAGALSELLLAAGIGVEAGLWSEDDARTYLASGIDARCLRILIEPREQTVEGALATAAAIEAVLDSGGSRTPRLLHGSQATAWPVLQAAIARSLDTRIGLEDTLVMPDGTPAPDNASLVTAARALMHEQGEDRDAPHQ